MKLNGPWMYVLMSEIKPMTKGHKLAIRGVSFGGIGGPNEVCRRGRTQSGDVTK